MELNTAIDSVGYRSKGPDDTRTMCAIKFSQPLLRLMRNPERVQLVLREPIPAADYKAAAGNFDSEGQASFWMKPRWQMEISENPAGYKLNFKAGSQQGEIAIAWSLLRARPPTPDGKGRIPCHWSSSTSRLIVDISTWQDTEPVQDVLFGSWGTVLVP